MRLFFGIALLIGGMGLFLLDSLAHSLARAGSIKLYNNQLQTFPVKQTYTKTELADALWQVWRAKMTLPQQDAYTVEELKTALSKTLRLGTSQDSANRSLFEQMIKEASGVKSRDDSGPAGAGFLALLVSAFLLGGYRQSTRSPEVNITNA